MTLGIGGGAIVTSAVAPGVIDGDWDLIPLDDVEVEARAQDSWSASQ